MKSGAIANDIVLAVILFGYYNFRGTIKMKEKLGKWELKGYKVTAARIRFIVPIKTMSKTP